MNNFEDCLFEFGPYEGQNISSVMSINKHYIRWAIINEPLPPPDCPPELGTYIEGRKEFINCLIDHYNTCCSGEFNNREYDDISLWTQIT